MTPNLGGGSLVKTIKIDWFLCQNHCHTRVTKYSKTIWTMVVDASCNDTCVCYWDLLGVFVFESLLDILSCVLVVKD